MLVAAGSIGLGVASLMGDSVATWTFLCIVYAGIGLFTAASYAYFMDHSRATFAATQFSVLMGATNLCEVWTAGSGGYLVDATGYGPAFILLAVVSLGALVFLRRSVLPGAQS